MNEAIKQSYSQSVKEKNEYLYVGNLIDTFNIIYAHLLDVEREEANFELDSSIFADAKRLINENVEALKNRKKYDELLGKDVYLVKRGHNSILK